MKRIALALIFAIPFFVNAQQQSDISIDSGNKNKITVSQVEGDSAQRANIKLRKSSGNDLKVEQQSKKDSGKTSDQPNVFMRIVHNTYYLTETSLAIAAIFGFLWKFFRKRRKQSKQ